MWLCLQLHYTMIAVNHSLSVTSTNGIPQGLEKLLLNYLQQITDSRDGHADAHKHLYRRLYSLLWVCVTITVSCYWMSNMPVSSIFSFLPVKDSGEKEGVQQPHVCFLQRDQAAIRARFPLGLREKPDPTGPKVWLKMKLCIAQSQFPLFSLQVYKVTIVDLATAKWPA